MPRPLPPPPGPDDSARHLAIAEADGHRVRALSAARVEYLRVWASFVTSVLALGGTILLTWTGAMPVPVAAAILGFMARGALPTAGKNGHRE